VITGNKESTLRGAWLVETLGEPLVRYPTAFGYALGAAELAVHGATEVAIVGVRGDAGFDALVRETSTRYLPSLVLASGDPDVIHGSDPLPLLRDRAMIADRATAYVCRGYVCEAPVTDPLALGEQLERAASGLTR
jgi:hypothetical protein